MQGYHDMLRPPAAFSRRTWAFLAIAGIAAAGLALGTHDLAIAHLGVPYPYHDGLPDWASYLGTVTRIVGIAWICRLGAWSLDRRSPEVAALLVGLLILLLQETIRVLIVNIAMVDGLVDRRWVFAVVDAVPNAATSFFNGVAGALIARWLLRTGNARSLLAAALAIAVAAAIGYFGVRAWAHDAATAIERRFGLVEAPTLYQMPYGRYIYAFIYTTFVEPTFATFVFAYLTWPGLPRNAGGRIAAFAALLLLARGRVVAILLFPHWVPQPPLTAIAAEGQFFAETLVMAALAGIAWTIATRRGDAAR